MEFEALAHARQRSRTMTLTRDMVLAMQPGPEMDKWVAPIMDWMPNPTPHNGGEWLTPPAKDGQRRWTSRPPPYSTDIAAAWQLRQELCRRNLNPAIYNSGATMDHYHKTKDARAVLVSLWRGEERIDAGADGIDSAPLALCRAALLATLKE